ncbi:MAG TPA: PAS domain-containing protein, partial [Draconibacterium sp.]|nr:PAS domain-containing protein [Draconibacterium sp.]
NLFSNQADKYNFAKQDYLDALEKVPRLSKHKLDHAKSFFLILAQSISQLSYSNIKLARSINQQKKVENKLRENEKLFNKAQEIAHLGSWSLDLQKNILTWSDELYQIFGLNPNEFKASYNGFLELVHPDDRDAVNAAYTSSVIEGKDSYEIEHRIIRKHSGEIRHVFEKCEHIKDESGEIIRSVGMTLDITERKEAVEALRENERLFRESQAAAKIGSYSTDLMQKTWKGTQAIYEIFGIDKSFPHTLDGWAKCIHPDFREILVNDLFSKDKRNIFEHEYKIIRVNDGEERWVYGHGKFEYDNQMNPVSLIGTIQDITERKNAEESLKQLNEELENRVKERTEELLGVTVQVEERERNRFSHELHDDLGPLLSATKLYFQWLAETENPDKRKIIIEKGNSSIKMAIQTARSISHGLGSQILNNLGFVGAIQHFAQSINDTQKINIDFKFNSNNRFGSFLEIILYRITMELINNTLKYAGATQIEIVFNYNIDENIIHFTYFDNGVGFDLSDVEKNSKGLGLMNIQHRIRLINGSIVIESAHGKGVKVQIEIPVIEGIFPKETEESTTSNKI